MSNDQTGYGYSPGGFAPGPWDNQAAQRKKYEMDRVSDIMQIIDPALQRTLEKFARTQVQNGNDPAAVRNFAYGSVPGQMASGVLMAARRNGLLGSGDPINYGANIMQGVAGGGFGMNMLSPAGRNIGMNQHVTGAGVFSGQVAAQLAGDVLTNLYGKGSSDPSRLYGQNMEGASQIFNTLANRGVLGNVASYKRYDDTGTNAYNSATAIRDKIENARRQEKNPQVLAALDGVTADNINERISKETNKAAKDALSNLESSRGTLVMDDQNTKRVTDTMREVIKGITNLKDVYGELNNPQLLAKMESLTGVRVTNQTEAIKANSMMRSLIGTAGATGHDPRAVIDMLTGRSGYNSQLYGNALGLDGAEGSTGKSITQGYGLAVAASALVSSQQSDYLRTIMNEGNGTTLNGRSLDKFQVDDERQMAKFLQMNRAYSLSSGMAGGSQAKNADFVRRQREIADMMARASNPREMAEANAMSERLIQSTLGVSSRAYGLTLQGVDDMASADPYDQARAAKIVSAGQSQTYLADSIMAKGGLSGSDIRLAGAGYKMGIGAQGMAKFMNGKSMRSAAAIDRRLAKMVAAGNITQAQADAMRKNLGSVSAEDFAAQISDVGNASGGVNSRFGLDEGAVEVRDKINNDQRSTYSDENGLNLKSIIRSIVSDPDKNGVKTDSQKLFAIEAMQKAGYAGGLAKPAHINTSDGYSQEEMDAIRTASKDKEFGIHKQLGFNTEAEMLAASKGDKNLQLRMGRALERSGKFMIGGTSRDLVMANLEDMNGLGSEQLRRFKLATDYDSINGLKSGEQSQAGKDIMTTGKLPDGSLAMTTDGIREGHYSDSGKTLWLGKNNRVNLSALGRISSLADRANGSDFESVSALNSDTNGGIVGSMEAELKSLKFYKARGIENIDTIGTDGKKTSGGIDEYMQKITDAITKLQAADGGEIVKQMTVTTLNIEHMNPPKN